MKRVKVIALLGGSKGGWTAPVLRRWLGHFYIILLLRTLEIAIQFNLLMRNLDKNDVRRFNDGRGVVMTCTKVASVLVDAEDLLKVLQKQQSIQDDKDAKVLDV